MSTIDAVEEAFAAAWEAHNRAEIVAIRQAEDPSAVAGARSIARSAIDAAVGYMAALSVDGLDAEDLRAVASMRETLDLLAADDPMLTLAIDTTHADDRPADDILATDGLGALLGRSAADFTRAADDLRFDDRPIGRTEVLGRLATEPDPGTRRRLFLGLEPIWRAVDGDGGPDSPYRIALRASSDAWRRDGSPVDANARALGVDPAELEPWLRAILAAWRDAAVGPGPGASIEPWDERFTTGTFSRTFDADLPLAGLRQIDRACYASLGADPELLGIQYDLEPRPGRGPVAMAFMLDVGIPRRGPTGWTTGEQWVVASYSRPRIPDLGELLHETGHAIHSWAIRTRPAFAVMTEAYTTLIEALGDIVAWDLYEPVWQERWLGRSASVGAGLRARYGDVVRDVAWSLFELVLHRDPERAPNEVWAEIASDYLGVVPHPEWSWWAVRGQLVQTPGYMVNYGLGAVVTADIRARLRDLRGDWLGGDPGWYEAVSAAIYRWGGERDPSDVLEAFLGRRISPDALIADISRIAGEGRRPEPA